MELDENRIIIVLAAVLSLLLNVLAFHLFNPRRASAAMDDYKLIELVDLPKQEAPVEEKKPEPNMPHQVVDLGLANPEDNTPPPDNPHYLSERNMRTKVETVRPSYDRTGSGGATPLSQMEQKGARHEPKTEPVKERKSTGDPTRLGRDDLIAMNGPGDPADASRKGKEGLTREDFKIKMSDLQQELKPDGGSIDYLPLAVRSDITSLNAMQYAYAAFYNRIKKIIRFYWEPQAALAGIQWSGGPLETRLHIVVDSDGTLNKVEVVASCGYPGVDAAAIRAVSKAAPFYNIPPALLNDKKQLDEVWAFYITPQ